jgi:TonB family protein
MFKVRWTHYLTALCALLATTGTLLAQPRKTSGAELSARLVSQVRPVYPPEAKAKGIQGLVRLDVTVSTKGEVTNVEVLSGPELLREASVEAVRQWRYQPSEYEVIGTVHVNFVLADKDKPAKPKSNV